jgi:hypothetical protein
MSITTTVPKAVTASITTAQMISNYITTYNMVEIQIATMISECSTARIALREIQGILNQNNKILLQKGPELETSVVEYIQTDFQGIIGTCLFVFSPLNE